MTTRRVRWATWADCLFFRRCYNLNSSTPVGLWEHLRWWLRTRHERRYVCEQAGTGKRYGYLRVDGSGVISIAVLSQFRRMGVGRQLLAAAIRGAREQTLVAWIAHENAASKKFFQSCGFERRPQAQQAIGKDMYTRKGRR